MARTKRDKPENVPPDLTPEEMSRVADFLIYGAMPEEEQEEKR
jgi:hypothetical protein